MEIAEKHHQRQNVIQITFASMALLWDLESNREVTSIWNQQQFASHEAFVPTGF
jgi:hypothetical protein